MIPGEVYSMTTVSERSSRRAGEDPVPYDGRRMSGVLKAGQEADMDGLPDASRFLFNVGGTLHETCLGTLRRFPRSRLCVLAEEETLGQCGNGLKDKAEVFLDRDPRLFAVILNFYRCGELHMPSDVCGPAMRRELSYWGVEELDMEPCCWMNYSTFADVSATLEEFEQGQVEHETMLCSAASTGSLSWRLRLYNFLEDPYSSYHAKIYAWVMMGVVFLSILVYCLETHPDLQVVYDGEMNDTVSLLQADYKLFHGSIKGFYSLVLVDNICNGIFLLEFLVRLAVAPQRWRFLKAPLNVIEVLCIVPYYIAVVLSATTANLEKHSTALEVLFLSRILRILRVFALMKHFQALKILVYTLRASTQELLLLVLILSLGMLLFASLMFQVESHTNGRKSFRHVFDALWWALVTMTTVGYGDLVPKTAGGYVVGSLCATSGILVIALTVPIIVNNFTLYYSHAQAKRSLFDRRQSRQGHCFLIPSQEASSTLNAYPGKIRERSNTLSFNRIRLESMEDDVALSSEKTAESIQSLPSAVSSESLVKSHEHHGGRTRISSAKVSPEPDMRY